MRRFLEEYEFLLLPVNQVPPFPANEPYVTEINGTKLPSYLDWMKTCYYISATSHPAISVPAGRTSSGLPVGTIQADLTLLHIRSMVLREGARRTRRR